MTGAANNKHDVKDFAIKDSAMKINRVLSFKLM